MGPGTIPFRVRVGVTGHRQIPADWKLEEQIRRALARIRELVPGRTPVRTAVVSPLAEGTDQLVAKIALEDDPEASLEALLPLSAAEYVKRFENEDSAPAFRDLAARASSVAPFDDAAQSPEKAYERVGRSVVDSSDVLLAVWDGEPARGPAGTATVVSYARQQGLPLVWIEARPPFWLREETDGRVFGESYRELDRFNNADVPRRALDAGTTERTARLLALADEAGLDREYVRKFCDWILPYYARADALADRWQRRYRRLTNTLFFAAAAAVAAVAAQVLFAPEHPRLVAVEVGLLASILAALFLGKRLRVHERRIAYRGLAERFRSALFLALAGAQPELETLAEQAQLGPTGEWPRRAFDEVWRTYPRASPPSPLTEPLKRFITEGLIEDQIRYHRRAAEAAHRRQRLLTRLSYGLFGTTLVAAVLHMLEVGGHSDGFSFANVLIFLAVGLPALAGALAGIEAQRQYERTFERSKGMAHRLELAADEMRKAPDLESVRAVTQKTEKILLDEANDWLVTVRFQGIKLAV